MSASGQKRICATHKGMSALPPIATAKADIPMQNYAPLYPKAYICGEALLSEILDQSRTGNAAGAGRSIVSMPEPASYLIWINAVGGERSFVFI